MITNVENKNTKKKQSRKYICQQQKIITDGAFSIPTENWLAQLTSAHAVSVQMIKATVGKEKGPSPDNSIELNPWQGKVKHWVM